MRTAVLRVVWATGIAGLLLVDLLPAQTPAPGSAKVQPPRPRLPPTSAPSVRLPEPLPDLQLSFPEASCIPTRGDEPGVVPAVRVTNAGEAPARRITVSFIAQYDYPARDGRPAGRGVRASNSATISSLAAGESQLFRFNRLFETPRGTRGYIIYYVDAPGGAEFGDTTGRIREKNENNNTVRVELNCR